MRFKARNHLFPWQKCKCWYRSCGKSYRGLGEIVTEECSCTKPQIVNVDGTEIRSHWKKLSPRTSITREKKYLASGFKASTHRRLSYEEGLMQLVVLSWSQCSTHRLIYAPHLHSLCFVNGTTEPGWQHLFSTWFPEYFKPTAETQCQNWKQTRKKPPPLPQKENRISKNCGVTTKSVIYAKWE